MNGVIAVTGITWMPTIAIALRRFMFSRQRLIPPIVASWIRLPVFMGVLNNPISTSVIALVIQPAMMPVIARATVPVTVPVTVRATAHVFLEAAING